MRERETRNQIKSKKMPQDDTRVDLESRDISNQETSALSGASVSEHKDSYGRRVSRHHSRDVIIITARNVRSSLLESRLS